MKKIILLLTLLFSTLVFCQKNSLLWKISGNGLKKPSYLYGTIHITCDATLSQKITKALDETQQLCLELDLDDQNMQAAMMRSMMMKDGATIESLTTKEDFKILDDYFIKEIGLSIKMMNTVKPFILSAMLYPKMIDCPVQSIETELMRVAVNQNEETIGLETIEEQMAVFDAIPYKKQIDELIKTIKNSSTADALEIKKMLEIYQTEDIDALLKFTQTNDNTITSEFADTILYDRNKKWIPKMEQMAKDKPTFFGVGAAHLAGENGVINLLKKKGFILEPIF